MGDVMNQIAYVRLDCTWLKGRLSTTTRVGVNLNTLHWSQTSETRDVIVWMRH